MALFDFLFGGKGQNQQLPTMTPEQQQMWSQMMQTLMPGFQGGQEFYQNILSGDTSAFEAPAMRQFQEQIAPDIAERYAGMGAGSSSGLNQSLAQASTDLSERLAAQRGQLQMQAAGQATNPLMQLLSMPQFENLFQEGGEGGIGALMKILMGFGGK